MERNGLMSYHGDLVHLDAEPRDGVNNIGIGDRYFGGPCTVV